MKEEDEEFWILELEQLQKELHQLPLVYRIINKGELIIADSYEQKNVCENLKIPHIRRNGQDVYVTTAGTIDQCIL